VSEGPDGGPVGGAGEPELRPFRRDLRALDRAIAFTRKEEQGAVVVASIALRVDIIVVDFVC
jgi:hypothetical protein